MNFFEKLFSSGKSKSEKGKDDAFGPGKYMPHEEVPVDEQFMLNFREKGGKFLYCDALSEAKQFFKNILLENDWSTANVCCFEPQIQKIFNNPKLKFSKSTNADFYCCSCEYLVGDSGGILVSSNQLKEKKLNELPDNMVVLAYTSQLTRDLSEGMKGIKNRKDKRIPTNITTIQLFESQKENNFLTYGSRAKNLYLLLVEDL